MFVEEKEEVLVFSSSLQPGNLRSKYLARFVLFDILPTLGLQGASRPSSIQIFYVGSSCEHLIFVQYKTITKKVLDGNILAH